jgi:hypothetical protein
MYLLRKLLAPDMFQGKYKTQHYFEGWYFKITDSKMEKTLAIIPGISIGEWDTHAFIQVMDSDHNVSYFHYDIDEFQYNDKKFEIMIGENYFSKSRIRLNIDGKKFSLQGDLYFSNIMEFPRTIFRPGVMGPFTYIPFMECNHDIISLQHDIIGHLKVSGKTVDFTDGIGYIEKDWGKSMPKSWVWFQSNHFQPDNVSLSVNIANVPLLKCSLLGFIIVFRYNDRIFMFTTYNGSWIKMLYYNKNRLRITVRDCRFRLDINITYAEGGTIIAPVKGQMCRNIVESMNSVVKLKLSDRKGNILYQGIGTNGGLEIVEE